MARVAQSAGAWVGPVALDVRDDGTRVSMTGADGKPYDPATNEGDLPVLRPGDTRFLSVPLITDTKRIPVRSADPDEWLQAVLIDSSARVAIARKLAPYRASGTAESAAQKRFVVGAGEDRTVEILVDQLSGAIVQESLYKGSRLVQRTTHRYEQRPDQIWVKSYSRTEVQSPDTKSSVRRMERYYRNSTFAARND